MTVVTKYKYLARSRRLMVWLRPASAAVHFQGGTSAPQCCVHFVPVDEACAEIEVLIFLMWSAEKEEKKEGGFSNIASSSRTKQK